jgi:hypothetical protein
MWRQIGIFTLNQNWQYSRPIDGILFRVRHLNVTQTRGQIAQGVLENGDLQLFEKQRLLSSDQPDLFEFVTPLEPGKRRIALRADAFSTPWRVALDYYEGGTVAPDYLALHNAHLNAASPHPQYLNNSALASALADRVTTSALTAALADKVTTSALMTALAANAEVVTLSVQTSDATLTEMVSPQRILIHANSVAGYEIYLTGRSAAATPEFIYWIGSGAIYRGSDASSTVLQTATGTRRSSLGNGTNWTPTVTADTVNGGLKIQVKGDAGKTVKWLASVQLTEVW